jgi:hypothetical protein
MVEGEIEVLLMLSPERSEVQIARRVPSPLIVIVLR